jgi:hypothetical protein
MFTRRGDLTSDQANGLLVCNAATGTAPESAHLMDRAGVHIHSLDVQLDGPRLRVPLKQIV